MTRQIELKKRIGVIAELFFSQKGPCKHRKEAPKLRWGWMHTRQMSRAWEFWIRRPTNMASGNMG